MARFLCILISAVMFGGQVQADVRCIQAYLAETAFDPGPVDGLWGAKTAAAIEGFVAQTGVEIEGGVGRSNSDQICAVFSADADGHLQVLGKYRSYPVAINTDLLADIDPTYFDFSGFNLHQGPDYRCQFATYTTWVTRNDTYRSASGIVDIIDGRLVFGRHTYTIGDNPIANESYLQDLSNLAILDTGQIVGRTPYFWDYTHQGRVARRPDDVTLSFRYEPGIRFPNGRSILTIPELSPDGGDFNGTIELSLCQER